MVSGFLGDYTVSAPGLGAAGFTLETAGGVTVDATLEPAQG